MNWSTIASYAISIAALIVGFISIARARVVSRTHARTQRLLLTTMAVQQARIAAGGWANVSPEERDAWIRKLDEAREDLR